MDAPRFGQAASEHPVELALLFTSTYEKGPATLSRNGPLERFASIRLHQRSSAGL